MATNHTTNYQLCQWEATDKVLRTDFNQDNQKIDAALAALEQGKGNCLVVSGSYTGTGEYGAGHPNQLTFDFVPLVIFLDISRRHSYNSIPEHYILHRACTSFVAPGTTNGSNTLTWTETSVSWYYTSTDEDGPQRQFNQNGVTYHYLALGTKEG